MKLHATFICMFWFLVAGVILTIKLWSKCETDSNIKCVLIFQLFFEEDTNLIWAHFWGCFKKISFISFRIFQYWNWWWWWLVRVDRNTNNNNNNNFFYIFFSFRWNWKNMVAKLKYASKHDYCCCCCCCCFRVAAAACYFVPNEAANVRVQEEWNECEETGQKMQAVSSPSKYICVSLNAAVVGWLVGWLVEIYLFFLSFRSKNVH